MCSGCESEPIRRDVATGIPTVGLWVVNLYVAQGLRMAILSFRLAANDMQYIMHCRHRLVSTSYTHLPALNPCCVIHAEVKPLDVFEGKLEVVAVVEAPDDKSAVADHGCKSISPGLLQRGALGPHRGAAEVGVEHLHPMHCFPSGCVPANYIYQSTVRECGQVGRGIWHRRRRQVLPRACRCIEDVHVGQDVARSIRAAKQVDLASNRCCCMAVPSTRCLRKVSLIPITERKVSGNVARDRRCQAGPTTVERVLRVMRPHLIHDAAPDQVDLVAYGRRSHVAACLWHACPGRPSV
mmetsp:Transcript_98249/g.248003  ORF Transcript_98249/g.248003 Transcript_98249/m.248003 type:complete len:296 (-) Transcript_98249:180-1067(-)